MKKRLNCVLNKGRLSLVAGSAIYNQEDRTRSDSKDSWN